MAVYDFDESRRIRTEDLAYEDQESRATDTPLPGAARLAVRTTTITSYPPNTAVNVFFGVEEIIVSGAETEGGVATVTGTGNKFLAANIGTQWPPNGTELEATFVPDRWTIAYNG